MKLLTLLFVGAALSLPACGQVFGFTREQMIKYTEQNPFERFPDGRPKVPDALLEKVKGLSVEEAWGLLMGKGYVHQYAGDWQILHPGKKLVGRAVTAQYLPLRPDLDGVIQADAKAKGLPRGNNLKVIDLLQPNDVPVIDLMGAESGHNFGGDNLAATFSPELADYTIYVIDVSEGDKIPRKGGPGIASSDLLVINKIDTAKHDPLAVDTFRAPGVFINPLPSTKQMASLPGHSRGLLSKDL